MTTSPVQPAANLSRDSQLTISELAQPIPHITLEGTLDTANSVKFNEYVRGPIPRHRGWVLIDAAKLNMLTSSGAGALIELASSASKMSKTSGGGGSGGGGLAMVIPPGMVRDAIGFMRLDLVIDTFDTFDAAVAFIDEQAK